ncbi:DUF4158 domain-containing protein [[Actinomadura] parvosata]|uniref:DUF4158 domain-containing protein n=1 Tax=[Actinomadura] parvosata TaxID=1955412 RepID=UPI003AAB004E
MLSTDLTWAGEARWQPEYSPTWRSRLRSFPEISREELIRFFTLTAADVESIDFGGNGGLADGLGLAGHLCTLPWTGFVPAAAFESFQAALVKSGRGRAFLAWARRSTALMAFISGRRATTSRTQRPPSVLGTLRRTLGPICCLSFTRGRCAAS